MTRQTPSYRDAYAGRGKYAIENNAMLDQEQLRLNAWQGESTRYKPTVVPLFFVAVGLLLALAISATVYFFAFGS
jgi:hypothetical protein